MSERRSEVAVLQARGGVRKPKAANAARQPSLAEAVYLRVKQDIFDFRLLPGDRFSEGQIAARLNVSRARAGLQAV